MKNTPNTIRANFELDPATIHSIQESQAASLNKAISEAVMNSIDSGSSHVAIIINPSEIVITDNGKGFENEKIIDEYFSTLGTKHYDGDAKFGRFRMGRAQLFGYGVNTWRSNTFKMVVDTKNRGMVHDVYTGLEKESGCTITIALYDLLSKISLTSTIRHVAENLKYAEIEVSLNGKTISQNPSTKKWTVEDEFAYYKPSTSSRLTVYNMGILVNSIPRSRVPCGGTLVTKQALPLNVARNDINMNSKMWQHIAKVLAENAPPPTEEIRSKDPLGAIEEKIASWLKGHISTLDMLKMPNPSFNSKTGRTLLSLFEKSATNNTPLVLNEAEIVHTRIWSYNKPKISKKQAFILSMNECAYIVEKTPISNTWKNLTSFIKEIQERIEKEIPEEKGKNLEKLLKIKSTLFLVSESTIKETCPKEIRTIIPDESLKKENLKTLCKLRELAEISATAIGNTNVLPIAAGTSSNGFIESYWIEEKDGQKCLVINETSMKHTTKTTKMATILWGCLQEIPEENGQLNESQAQTLNKIYEETDLIKNISEFELSTRLEEDSVDSTLISQGISCLNQMI